MRRTVALAVLVAATLAVPAPASAAGPVVSVVAAGDIACAAGDPPTAWRCAQQATADLIAAANPDAVLPLGDLQYPDGTFDEFVGGYGPTWGRFKARTYPAPGNHEWHTTNAQGYRDYFTAGAPAAVRVDPLWYSYDLGGWHLVSLDSDCEHVGGCDPGSPQTRWFAADLATHDGQPTLVYWHHPRWSSGGDQSTRMAAIWTQAVADRDVQIALAGHDHDYERFARMGVDGPDKTGIRQFVVGSGGKGHGCGPGSRQPGSKVFDCATFGVLRLWLHPDGSYAWRFAPVAGSTFTDTGSSRRRAKNL